MKKRFGGVCVVLAVASLAVVGCGGDNLRCGEVAPCGGNIVGSWEMKGACADTSAIEAASADACPGFRLTRFSVQVSGSVTFTATDYTSSAMATIDVEEEIPTSCPLLGGTTCAELDASLQANPDSTGRCTGDTTCTCSITTTSGLFGGAGTYAISGSMLSLTSTATGVTQMGGYCVSEGMLHFPSVGPAPMGMMGEMIIESDFVGERL